MEKKLFGTLKDVINSATEGRWGVVVVGQENRTGEFEAYRVQPQYPETGVDLERALTENRYKKGFEGFMVIGLNGPVFSNGSLSANVDKDGLVTINGIKGKTALMRINRTAGNEADPYFFGSAPDMNGRIKLNNRVSAIREEALRLYKKGFIKLPYGIENWPDTEQAPEKQ